jgi:shikimate kinase
MHEGKTISQIFSESGEMEFRKMEAEYLRKTAQFSNSVIATGGGTPCFFENMEWMNNNGITIFLNASPGLISLRLATEKAKRPLLNSLTDEELAGFIQKKLAERIAFYHQAQLQLEILGDDDSAVSELSAYLKRFIKKA